SAHRSVPRGGCWMRPRRSEVLPEADDALAFLEAERAVHGDARVIAVLRARCEFRAPLRTAPRLDCRHQRGGHAPPPPRRLHEEAFQVRDPPGMTALRVRPDPRLREADRLSALRHGEEDFGLAWRLRAAVHRRFAPE